MALNILSLFKVVLPKRNAPGGTSVTASFNPRNTEAVLTLPTYRDHQTDIFTSRQADDSRALLQQLFIHDPDTSAAVNAFLTVANTTPVFVVKNIDGMIDRPGQQALNTLLRALTTRFDYSTGFQMTPSVEAISENMRYMVLLRGAIAAELLFNKLKLPYGVRQVDAATLRWTEKTPGVYKPQQVISGSNEPIDLDIPSFFVSFFRRDPTRIYTFSPFVSSINTVAARQQVINDLYRIMRFTGFPRIEVTVLEEVLRKHAPATLATDPEGIDAWIRGQVAAIATTVSDMRADQAFVHTDSVEAKILNNGSSSAAGMNIDSIIGTLNAQNQAGLRSMSTILGRGETGVNTASVEARIFAMNAEEINEPVAEIWSQMLTMAIRLMGYDQLFVECRFLPAEMRSALELEPHLVIKSTRLRTDLSDGLISDDEYHMEMYGRIRPDATPELSGTGFAGQSAAAEVDPNAIAPTNDPLARAITTPGAKAAKGNLPNKRKNSQSKPLT